tara:strand:- start:424 stop:945 length:522 start_codon:yes stop_codon:yes gene_type:complete
MGWKEKNYLIYQKLSKIYNLLEEIYPWATPYLLFNFNTFPKHLLHFNLGYNQIWKPVMFYLCNVDKFTIEKPKLFDSSIISEGKKFNFIIPNLNKLTKEDVKNFPPIQISTWKGKTNFIVDGMHRAYIAKELKEPIMCVEFKSHSYNNHPNNKKIIKLAKDIKNITNSVFERN